MTYERSHRGFYSNQLYGYACAKCKRDTPHQRGVCTICKTISTSPARHLSKAMMKASRRDMACRAAQGCPYQLRSSTTAAGARARRISRDKQEQYRQVTAALPQPGARIEVKPSQPVSRRLKRLIARRLQRSERD